ncbi:hypothetical protein SD340_003630 [Vibrio fluvialis]|nr:hypothetical protein [Vibrio fluvialis]
MVKYGDHGEHDGIRKANEQSIANWYAENKLSFKHVIEEYRDIQIPSVPLIENIFNDVAHQMVYKVEGKFKPGIRIECDYREKIRNAIKTKDRTLELFEVEEYYSALSKMVSAIESYFNYKAQEHNIKLGHSALIDNQKNPVPLIDKFTKWVPAITGKPYDKSGKSWGLFVNQLKTRNDYAIHPKNLVSEISFEDLANHLNEFRDGIVSVLYDLQTNYFNERVKGYFIREVYQTDVFVTYEEREDIHHTVWN